MVGGDVRFYRNGLADGVDGHAVLSGLMGERAQQMQGVGMARIQRQHLAIDTLGLDQAAGAMMPQAGSSSAGRSG